VGAIVTDLAGADVGRAWGFNVGSSAVTVRCEATRAICSVWLSCGVSLG
jgi:hypothetical protein